MDGMGEIGLESLSKRSLINLIHIGGLRPPMAMILELMIQERLAKVVVIREQAAWAKGSTYEDEYEYIEDCTRREIDLLGRMIMNLTQRG